MWGRGDTQGWDLEVGKVLGDLKLLEPTSRLTSSLLSTWVGAAWNPMAIWASYLAVPGATGLWKSCFLPEKVHWVPLSADTTLAEWWWRFLAFNRRSH